MTYKVKSGDTLSKIAKANGLTLAQLLDANPRFRANPNKIRVGDAVTIPNGQAAQPTVQPTTQPTPRPPAQPTPPPAPQPTAQKANGLVLGKLSEKFETGGRGCGTVSGGQGDRGGVSYGTYQMSSKPNGGTVTIYIKESDFPFKSNFANLVPGTAQFTSAWKQLAAAQAEAFQANQHEFIKRTHFDKLAAKVKARDGLDVTTRSHALQDVMWSTAVQHGSGGGAAIVHTAIGTLGGLSQSDPDFDRRLIIAIYAERGRTRNGVLVHFSGNSPAVQKGVANRFKAEQTLALKMLARES
jgi:murein DD-endopeptidase MepM/ murein hydrolase activator NlpD